MAILHKNISSEGDIHNPKWFSGANNGDVAWRNELGVLESTDELVLPAALNFVDGSVAPPTSNSGDIYVLSSGASVNAGWGTVALGDWVRYDGTSWNVITPQKSTLCYNETTDALNSYDGSTWSAIGSGGGGGDSIYTADGTTGANRIVTITDKLSFRESGGVNNVFKIFETGDVLFGSSSGGINSKFFANGEVALGGNTIISGAAGITLHKNTLIKAESDSQNVLNIIDTSSSGIFQVKGNGTCILGGNSLVSTEKISLQSSTAIKGNGTSTGSALAIYNNDTTPVKLWDFLDNGNVNLGGGDKVVSLGSNDLTFNTGTTGKFVVNGSTTTEEEVFTFQHLGDSSFFITKNGEIKNKDVAGINVLNITNKNKDSGIILNSSLSQVLSPQLLFRKSTSDANGVRITTSSTSEETKWQRTSSNDYVHQIKSGTTTNIVNLFKLGWTNSQGFLVGSGAKIGSEDISLQGDTLLNANVNMPNLPTSATGLSSGDLWNDGGTLKIV